ncbi:MAG: hypothetical protein B0D96_04075 [Candidatus Sedimenticola endophacoides]|nr:MAG: hypothetical protein B0D94_08880 [Candidatus Sedimenticola endophacoides]OQX36517.1 MAG: hypothetical protein B0D96_04075 [Candidatus Sedimenticola endophacoides]OQX48840.1 MAG: hypothetical protein B0D87_03560 [Candidatus Sedimenticola endophacoides]
MISLRIELPALLVTLLHRRGGCGSEAGGGRYGHLMGAPGVKHLGDQERPPAVLFALLREAAKSVATS